jgi:UDP-glucose 4-epimerase
MLFSSSCSVYGTPNVDVVNEQTATGPESPYGETKLVSEWIIRDVARVRSQFRHTSLRYFNVVGSGSPEIADQSPHNLFPLVLRALTEGRTPMIWGGDYPTRDRTCVRDYIHVVDLAEAHLAAAERLESDQPAAAVYNVGRGEGSTVREVMETIGRVTGIDFQPEVRERRPGDPAHIVASADLIERDLGWEARLGLEDMVASAWQSWRHNVELQAERLDVSS